MERRSFSVSLPKNPSITMKVIPGHFTTSHSHLNYYLDLSHLKTNARMAMDVARELVLPYMNTTLIDAIVCIEGTEVIGAYMAEELIREGTSIMNSDREIHVVTPLNNINRKLMFQGNIQELIYNKKVLLLVPSISTGATINSILECLSYYGGILAGVSALFHAYPEKLEQEVHTLFTYKDIPGYEIYNPRDCVLCKNGLKLDAIIIHDGYTKI